jgi:hypothetical protein
VRIRLNLHYSFHKNIRGRERKWIKSIKEELEKESLGFEELGALVKPKLGFLKTRGKGDGFLFIVKL